MIGNHFIGPIEVDNTRTRKARLTQGWLKQMEEAKAHPSVSSLTGQSTDIYPSKPSDPYWGVDKIEPGSSTPGRKSKQIWWFRWTCHYRNPQETCTISLLEDEIEQYVFNQWEFAICNTFFAVDDLQYWGLLKHDAREYPAHLGYSWYLCKSPQDIYQITKQITGICKMRRKQIQLLLLERVNSSLTSCKCWPCLSFIFCCIFPI